VTASLSGCLVLVATPIGNLGDLSPRAVSALRDADVICCEDTRHTRRLLTHAGITGAHLVAVHEHNEAASSARVLGWLGAGRTVALVTDAGTPAVSDPGRRLVAAAVAAGAPVTVVPGPSAAVAALVVSGLATDRWCFEGFLPVRGGERARRLAALRDEARAVVLFEAPHRMRRTLSDLATALGPGRPVALARELTKLHEEVWRGTLGEAVAELESREPRGEYVIVLGGMEAGRAANVGGPLELAAAVAERVAAGDERKAAIVAVARDRGVPRREVYDAVVGRAGRDREGPDREGPDREGPDRVG
jgi:16S rRNA (cytidine1402-2'-O)-methyltransferase